MLGSRGHSPRRLSCTSWPGCRATKMWHRTSYSSARRRFNREKFSSVASLSLGRLNAIAISVSEKFFSTEESWTDRRFFYMHKRCVPVWISLVSVFSCSSQNNLSYWISLLSMIFFLNIVMSNFLYVKSIRKLFFKFLLSSNFLPLVKRQKLYQ